MRTERRPRGSFVFFGLAGFRRISATLQAKNTAGVSTPHTAVYQIDRIAIPGHVHAVIAFGIDSFIWLGPASGNLAVAIRVQNSGTPPLRGLCIVGLIESPSVNPS